MRYQQMGTILIVEDDALLRKMLVAELSDKYWVRSSCDGNEALAILRRHPVDLVILDMIIPGADAFIVLSRAVNSGHDIRVIVLTVADQPQNAVKAMQLGASDYLVKPCDLRTLRLAISDVLGCTGRTAATGRAYC